MGPSRTDGSSPSSPLRAHGVRPDGRASGDTVEAAFAVLAVTAALARYVVERAVRTRRSPLPHVSVTGHGPVLRRVLPRPVVRVLARPASAAVRALAMAADELVPDVTRAVLSRLDIPSLVRDFVPLDRLAALLDVDAVVARVDIDAVIDRVDLDAIAARLDLDAVAARLNLDVLVDKVDVARVVDRVDLDAIVARVDLDAVVDRVDLDRAVNRVDLDAVVDRVDLDRAVDRVDVDRVIARTDVAGLARYVVEEIDLPGLLRVSTGSVTAEMVRGVRDEGVDADRAVERVVDRLLHRSARRTATGLADRPPGGTP
ncbi:MAG: uncharacterized protein JWP40_4079 [Blastococcus sp.]|nr:uncharacterized protein [Blastococcus sp.]